MSSIRWLAVAGLVVGCVDDSEGERTRPAEVSPLVEARAFEVSIETIGTGISLQSDDSQQAALDGLGGLDPTHPASLSWRGEIIVVDIEERNGQTLRRMEFARQDSAVLSMGGQEQALPSFAELGPVDFVVDSSGRIERVILGESHHTIAQNVIQQLLSHALLLDRPKAGVEEWVRVERDMVGRSEATWRRVGDGEFRRATSRYLDVALVDYRDAQVVPSGAFKVVYSGAELVRVEGQRTLRFSNDGVEQKRETVQVLLKAASPREVKVAEGDPAWRDAAFEGEGDWAGVELGGLQITSAIQESVNRQRAAGITVEQVIGYATTFDALGRRPDHLETFKRAMALVELDSSVVPKLLAEALHEDTGTKGLAFILDVFVGAETPEAQDAILEILTSEKMRSESVNNRAAGHQRLAHIQSPTDSVYAYGRSAYEEHGQEDTVYGRTTVMAFGSLIGGVRTGVQDLGVEQLLNGLQQSDVPAVIEAHLLGIANSGIESLVPHIVSRAQHPHYTVRGGAAVALSFFPGAEVEPTLLGIAKDDATSVQAMAIQSLRKVSPEPTTCKEMVDMTLEGEVAPPNLVHLTRAVDACPGPQKSRLYAYLRTLNGLEPALQERLRAHNPSN